MKNFPTDTALLRAIEKSQTGIGLTDIIRETHSTFDFYKYGKQGHRAIIIERLVKRGLVTEHKVNGKTRAYRTKWYPLHWNKWGYWTQKKAMAKYIVRRLSLIVS